MTYQNSAQAAAERREQLAVRAYDDLCEEWLDAATKDPRREVSTPAHHHPREQLIYLVLDEFSQEGGEDWLVRIIEVLRGTEQGVEILQEMAREHARYHCAARLMDLMECDDE